VLTKENDDWDVWEEEELTTRRKKRIKHKDDKKVKRIRKQENQ